MIIPNFFQIEKDFLPKLRNSGHSHVDLRDFVPGPIVNNASYRQSKYRLKFLHSRLCSRSIDTICIHPGQCRICLCDHVELFLHLQNLTSAGPHTQIISRPGGRNTGDLHCRINIDTLSIIIPQNLNRRIPLLSQTLRTPLSHPAPGRIPAVHHNTGSGSAVSH